MPPLRQAGLLLPALLAGMLGLVLIVLALRERISLDELAGRRAARQEHQQAEVAGRLRDWYQIHLAAAGPDPLVLPDQALPGLALTLAGLGGPVAWQVALGSLHGCPGARGRSLFAWRDAAEGGASFDAARQQVVGRHADTQVVVVDGCVQQQDAARRASATLQQVAQRLEAWFQARVADDPLHRLDRDYFQAGAPDCAGNPDLPPCLEDFAPVAGAPFFQRQLGLQAADLSGPWGADYPVEASAGPTAGRQPPFSLALRMRTPWGDWLMAQAVQPGA